MVLVAQAIKNTTPKLYDHRTAATYLNISQEEFLAYANTSGLLAYQLLFGTRVYTESELIRFKNGLNAAEKT